MKLGDWKYYAYLLSSSLDFPVNNRSDLLKTEGANFRLAFLSFLSAKIFSVCANYFLGQALSTIDIKERKERERRLLLRGEIFVELLCKQELLDSVFRVSSNAIL